MTTIKYIYEKRPAGVPYRGAGIAKLLRMSHINVKPQNFISGLMEWELRRSRVLKAEQRFINNFCFEEISVAFEMQTEKFLRQASALEVAKFNEC